MAKKVRVYGKQKPNDFASVFSNLNISPSPEQAQRAALSPVSPNARPGKSNGPKPILDEGLSSKGKAAQSSRYNASLKSKSPNIALEKVLYGRNNLSIPDNLNLRVSNGKCKSTKRQLAGHDDEIKALTSLEFVRSDVRSFDDVYDDLAKASEVQKIAEGSYASILRVQKRNDHKSMVIIKLMPIKPKGKNDPSDDFSTLITDAASEIKVLNLMCQSYGFVEFRSAQVVRGKLPKLLHQHCVNWSKENPKQPTSYKDKNIFKKNQLWLLIEMGDAGTDLESLMYAGFPDGTILNKPEPGRLLTIHQTWDIFWGVAEALSNGEALAEFEHRDLHLGNICIKKKTLHVEKSATSAEIITEPSIPRYTDLEVTLIDYTLARAQVTQRSVLANCMQDKGIFGGKGTTENDNRQYDVYRSMRTIVEGTNPDNTADTTALWKKYYPRTNMLWLEYILELLLKETEYCRTFMNQRVWSGKPGDLAMVTRLMAIRENLRMVEPKHRLYNSTSDLVREQLE